MLENVHKARLYDKTCCHAVVAMCRKLGRWRVRRIMVADLTRKDYKSSMYSVYGIPDAINVWHYFISEI